ncbi:HD domain-containing phosphohydrolase [Poriferisphaera sp. WC338]|uniref:HD-GYP domain-containing protein n=1 Tax=Poriferisphaera sp. WC338 TaxID=3425129 RepID=UPI003D813F13
MILNRTQSLPAGVSPKLRQRIDELGLSVLDLSSTGKCYPVGQVDIGLGMMVGTRAFMNMIGYKWEELSAETSEVVEVCDGLYFAKMPIRRRRRTDERFGNQMIVVVLLGSNFIGCEFINEAARELGLQTGQLISQLSPKGFVSADEAQRLASMLIWMYEDVSEVDRRLTELQGMSTELSESYEELSLLYKLSVNMRVNQEPALFLSDACEELQQVVGFRWLALQLIDDDPRLGELAGKMIVAGDMNRDNRAVHEVGRYFLMRIGDNNQCMVYDNTSEANVPLLSKLASTMLIVPLHFDGKPLGVMFGGDKLDGSHISSVDTKLCDSLVNSLSIFLGNMMLYEDTQSMFLGTLHALTSAIDAKDSYTHGHSERVALMSKLLAEAAGMDAHFIERTYIAGMLHDVGKIGVPESVLCKPGKLTDQEFDLIKRHPEIGAHILQDIRQMQDLIPGVLCHHERWDGRGYPNNLVGENIPMMGRVIGLADSFDAMSSNRTYRKALDLTEVLKEITRCKGSQFDPDLADVFVRLNFDPFFELIEKHQTEQGHRRIA